MIISHSKKFIYIKTERAATTATEKLLETVCTDEDIIGWKGRPPKPDDVEYYNHMTAAQIKEKVTSEQWDTYYKFGNIRNPWDRIVSVYFFRKDVLSKHPHNNTDWGDGESFEEFVLNRRLPRSFSTFFQVTNEDEFQDMDFYIRTENIQEDIMMVSNELNLDLDINLLPPLRPFTVEEGTRNLDYTSYYNDTTKDFIAHKYRKDIEEFGYTF